MLLGFRIEALAALGRAEEARAQLPELLASLEQRWAPHYDLEAWTGAGIAALALGETAAAQRCATEVVRLSRILGAIDDRSRMLRHRRRATMLAEKLGVPFD